jgi:transposase
MNTLLFISAHEYTCMNDQCLATTVVERYDGFLGYYGRFTERCEDFIETLALETSCEGAARICKEIGIQVSGDTIIRILKKRFEQLKVESTEECIGVDDFSTKKGNKYCTIVCNGNSHTPIAILDGRDGASLKKWLKNNKHVKTVTRDRASAYAKVIREELPDAMQIADRFHLHQNLLETVKKALSANIPQTIRILQNDATIQNQPSNSATTEEPPLKSPLVVGVDKKN